MEAAKIAGVNVGENCSELNTQARQWDTRRRII
jgi:hypothetical protein